MVVVPAALLQDANEHDAGFLVADDSGEVLMDLSVDEGGSTMVMLLFPSLLP